MQMLTAKFREWSRAGSRETTAGRGRKCHLMPCPVSYNAWHLFLASVCGVINLEGAGKDSRP